MEVAMRRAFRNGGASGGRLPEAGTNAINSANERRQADPRIATIPEKVTPRCVSQSYGGGKSVSGTPA
jgi:N-methylhydantoinase B/oxoprolinase/acetone carboxylase alpha subunit